jgi:tRNA pseudouridine55 synthase
LANVGVDAATAALVANGRVLPAFGPGAGPWAVFAPDATLLAVYERFGEAGDAKPAVVLPTAVRWSPGSREG